MTKYAYSKRFIWLAILAIASIIAVGTTWGIVNNLQQVGTTTITSVKQVVTEGDTIVALTKDGKVYTRGDNSLGQLGYATSSTTNTLWRKVNIPGTVKSISGLASHTLALTSTGKLYTFGDNRFGTRGDGSTNINYKPTQVTATYRFSKLTTGNNFALALDSNGNLWSWGTNLNGQLGTGNKTALTYPALVNVKTKFRDISAGQNYALAVSKDGTLYAWGQNNNGQLGTGNKKQYLTPHKVKTSQTNYTNVYTNPQATTSVALDTNGYIHTWGNNTFGQLGTGVDWRKQQRQENARVKQEIANIQAQDAAKKQSLIKKCIKQKTQDYWNDHPDLKKQRQEAIKARAEAQTQEVQPSTSPSPSATPTPSSSAVPSESASPSASPSPTPTPLPSIPKAPDYTDDCTSQVESSFTPTDTSNIKPKKIKEPDLVKNATVPHVIRSYTFNRVAVGTQNVYAINGYTGRVYAWGVDDNGQNGNNIKSMGHHTQVPVAMTSVGLNFNEVAAGTGWAGAVTTTGDLYLWGSNQYGSLMDTDSTLIDYTPQQVQSGVSNLSISYNTGAYTKNSTTYMWGKNTYQQAGMLASKGTQITTPIALKRNFSQVAISQFGTLALSGNNKLYYWGTNSFSLFGNKSVQTNAVVATPTTNSVTRFTQISAGKGVSYAVDTQNVVWGWGINTQHQIVNTLDDNVLTYPTVILLKNSGTITNIASTSSGGAATTSTRQLFVWGNNSKSIKSYTLTDSGKELVGTDDTVSALLNNGTLASYYMRSRVYNGSSDTGISKIWGTASGIVSLHDSTLEYLGNPTLTGDIAIAKIDHGAQVLTVGSSTDKDFAGTDSYFVYVDNNGTIWGVGGTIMGAFGTVTVPTHTPIPLSRHLVKEAN